MCGPDQSALYKIFENTLDPKGVVLYKECMTHHLAKPVHAPNGVLYPSATAAAKAYGLSKTSVATNCKYGKCGWGYVDQPPVPATQLSVDDLRKLLRYDAGTGALHRRDTGRAIGSWDNAGYLVWAYRGRGYKVHRLVWAHQTGAYPVHTIDHIDHDKGNNLIENLRDVKTVHNGRNKSRFATNTSGVVGVVWHKRDKCWQASIMVDGSTIHLGYFDEKEDAASARAEAEIRFGFHPNHGTPK